MSESDAHRNLVRLLAETLKERYPGATFSVDLQKEPGDEVPFLINGFRPDVYAHEGRNSRFLIAEAKTSKDLETPHTHDQIQAFIEYLESMKNGYFTLAAWGNSANHAKTILQFIRRELRPTSTMFEIFDGCDFWVLGEEGDEKWRLS